MQESTNFNIPKTSRFYLDLCLDHANSLGMNVTTASSDIGLSEEIADSEDPWIPVEYVAKFCRLFWCHTNDALMGFYSSSVSLDAARIFCEYLIGAKDLRELYQRALRFLNVLPIKNLGLKSLNDNHYFTLIVTPYEHTNKNTLFLLEIIIMLLHRFPCWATNSYIPLDRAYCKYSCPPQGDLYEEQAQAPVVFNHSFNGFRFHEKYLKLPIERTNLEFQTWLANAPIDLLRIPGRESTIEFSIRSKLSDYLTERSKFPTFEDTCEMLLLSPQVVRRRLTEEGSSFQKLKNMVRIELIKQLLLDPNIPIADIAEKAGFSEPAVLSRAFKKWTGLTPAQHREKYVENS